MTFLLATEGLVEDRLELGVFQDWPLRDIWVGMSEVNLVKNGDFREGQCSKKFL